MTSLVEQSGALIERSRALREVSQHLIEEIQAQIAINWRLRSGWFGIRGGADTPTSAGGGTQQRRPSPLDELERLVRDKIKRGALFILQDGRAWPSPATMQPCIVCGQMIDRGNDYEVRGPRGYLHTHVVCHSIWHRESLALRRDGVRREGDE